MVAHEIVAPEVVIELARISKITGGVISVMTAIETITSTDVDMAMLPAASYARAVQECVPLSTPAYDQSYV